MCQSIAIHDRNTWPLTSLPGRAPLACLVLLVAVFFVFGAEGVQARSPEEESFPSSEDPTPQVPQRVDVDPTAADDVIAARIQRILRATDWFGEPRVRVEEGIVFLQGLAESESRKEWAGRVAGNTEGVVAVVNRIETRRASMWGLSPAWSQVRDLAAGAVRSIPLFLLGVGLLALTWLVSGWTARGARALLRGRLKSELLLTVLARSVAIPVFLLGLYLVLKVSGLTRLAVTVLGGTGLLGLVLGFAFRDIAENFLASVLISLQRPFARGDLIEVSGFKGFVQGVNARSTLLMTLEGNHVQISNATIYKSTIINYSANPNVRLDFVVGIGYADSIAEAQSVALGVLRGHQAILADPDSLVLVESLGAATVNLRAYFWVNGKKYSGAKVRSAVIRLTKSAFDDAGISMPDEAREVVFPNGVPVVMRSEKESTEVTDEVPVQVTEPRSVQPETNVAEGDLSSEAQDIEEQAKKSRMPEGGNILEE